MAVPDKPTTTRRDDSSRRTQLSRFGGNATRARGVMLGRKEVVRREHARAGDAVGGGCPICSLQSPGLPSSDGSEFFVPGSCPTSVVGPSEGKADRSGHVVRPHRRRFGPYLASSCGGSRAIRTRLLRPRPQGERWQETGRRRPRCTCSGRSGNCSVPPLRISRRPRTRGP